MSSNAVGCSHGTILIYANKWPTLYLPYLPTWYLIAYQVIVDLFFFFFQPVSFAKLANTKSLLALKTIIWIVNITK